MNRLEVSDNRFQNLSQFPALIIIVRKLWYISILYSLHKPVIECNYNGYMYIMTWVNIYIHKEIKGHYIHSLSIEHKTNGVCFMYVSMVWTCGYMYVFIFTDIEFFSLYIIIYILLFIYKYMTSGGWVSNNGYGMIV